MFGSIRGLIICPSRGRGLFLWGKTGLAYSVQFLLAVQVAFLWGIIGLVYSVQFLRAPL